jgi:hypothetical protein
MLAKRKKEISDTVGNKTDLYSTGTAGYAVIQSSTNENTIDYPLTLLTNSRIVWIVILESFSAHLESVKGHHLLRQPTQRVRQKTLSCAFITIHEFIDSDSSVFGLVFNASILPPPASTSSCLM